MISFGILTIVYWPIAVCGVVGAVLVAATRADAFEAADRQNKWVWTALLGGSALALFSGFPFLSWIGIVIIGLYWFDVRPQITNILNGNYGW
ncbi:DUF2516 family protein [Corynebacterium diphtheriae]|uniref:DUF2516 family protein n=1 Tax=Corynebacterium diphtheriae TaxID=1717 RepID=UPI0008FB97C8|nr:DUF2516 family protein [Corynebacterium diphtheriae]MBG9245183.1 DUF2516 family protein [Corynebacterium diphtheriae bv. mitis]MBG9292600.1 DUF2516 family protein [Corynebacterium diphtheriae bv. gravis]MBG9303758.1 DUF2516 family protein [Corynebacterium diphtheriae bv. mitis]MBG9305801.1 DUF2516 family protein [Corynebacterium diphtheriae bv. mitis]MBG9342775.1 DUF2516 family protein [Corynebacterium diphtheriae]